MAKLRVWLAAALLAAGAWSATPSNPPTQPVNPKPAAKAAPAKPRLSDSQLESVIRAKFAKSKINADRFTVHVQGGIATIEGRTDVIQHKGVATRMCKTAGASAVSNRVQISEAARQKASNNLERGRQRAQVKRSEPRTDHK
ncbi:MAG: BON domain-containing protein [Candidatus Solibacter sp.]